MEPAAHENGGWQNWDRYTNLPVGEILRRTRLHHNLTLQDVEAQLRIRAAHLGALEDGRVDTLPGRVYAIGFVRAYAEYLGLDGGAMVELFKSQDGGGRTAMPALHFPAAASESKAPNFYILGGSAVGLILFIILLVIFGGGDKTINDVPSVEEARASSADATAGEVAGAEAAESPVKPTARIVITAVESAWIEVRNAKGKAIFSQILKEGDSYLVPEEKGLRMDTGNAGALQMVIDGGTPFRLGEHGDVRRGLKLDPGAFDEAQAKAASGAEPQAGAAVTSLPDLGMPAVKDDAGGETAEGIESVIEPIVEKAAPQAAEERVVPASKPPAARKKEEKSPPPRSRFYYGSTNN